MSTRKTSRVKSYRMKKYGILGVMGVMGSMNATVTSDKCGVPNRA